MQDNSDKKNVGLNALGQVIDPGDFTEGGREYRRNILFSTSLTFVLLLSSSLKPELFGVIIPPAVMWSFLGIAHTYFFVMWRLTSTIEGDEDKVFWNLRGLWKQATARGISGFPGKTKAQLLLIRSLPIWAFAAGSVGLIYGLYTSLR